MRINQFIARCGIASRRKSEEIIRSGQVTVNGAVTKDLAKMIDPQKDVVLYLGKKIFLPEKKYYILNKPAGYTSTRRDPYAQKTIYELVPRDKGLVSVGRLDRDTEGLIVITNDGQFAQKLIHPRYKIEKEYEVTLNDVITPQNIQKLISGVTLKDGPAVAVKVTTRGEREITITIEEGRKRIVRRMIQSINNKVVGLKRIRIGIIKLDVPSGIFREMTQDEVEKYA